MQSGASSAGHVGGSRGRLRLCQRFQLCLSFRAVCCTGRGPSPRSRSRGGLVAACLPSARGPWCRERVAEAVCVCVGRRGGVFSVHPGPASPARGLPPPVTWVSAQFECLRPGVLSAERGLVLWRGGVLRPAQLSPETRGRGLPAGSGPGPSLGRGLASRGLPLPRWAGLSSPAWGSPIRWFICTGIGRWPVTGGGRCPIGGHPVYGQQRLWCPSAVRLSPSLPLRLPCPPFLGRRGDGTGAPRGQSGDVPRKASLVWALKDRHSWERHRPWAPPGFCRGEHLPLWSRDPQSGPLRLQPGSGRRPVSSVRARPSDVAERASVGEQAGKGGLGGHRGGPRSGSTHGPSLEPEEAVSGRPRRTPSRARELLGAAAVLPQRLADGGLHPGVGRQLSSSAAERA